MSNATILRQTIDKTLEKVQKQQQDSVQKWNIRKQELLKQCFFSIHFLEKFLTARTQQFQNVFDDKKVKDELFKLFYGNEHRIGQYYLLHLFQTSETSTHSLMLAWDIRTATISFKMARDINDGMGHGVQIVDNFFSKRELLETREKFLRSNPTDEHGLNALVRLWSIDTPLINQRISEQAFWKSPEDFLIFLGEKYASTANQSVIFSKRCKSNMQPETSVWMPRVGDTKHAGDRARELIQELLDEAYLDSQKIAIDIGPPESNITKMVERTVKWVRSEICKRATRSGGTPYIYWYNVVQDEPKNYSPNASFGAGD